MREQIKAFKAFCEGADLSATFTEGLELRTAAMERIIAQTTSSIEREVKYVDLKLLGYLCHFSSRTPFRLFLLYWHLLIVTGLFATKPSKLQAHLTFLKKWCPIIARLVTNRVSKPALP
jgi:hypothetical protein